MPELFTLPELDAWAQAAVPVATGTLALELVTSLIRSEVGADRYDALLDLSPLKPVALGVARRMIRNADGRRSVDLKLDDFSETVTYASETLAGPFLTPDDVDRLWRALGVRRSGAFTIRTGCTV
ncbi:hypothetical protein ACIBEF_00525 [Micromonospora sp. NPDC050795]|uniref:hypothetical protein n=1 Tax=Micromonospora sp. NPDC050795 TaxID=3364282 RepID=UPI003788EF18